MACNETLAPSPSPLMGEGRNAERQRGISGGSDGDKAFTPTRSRPSAARILPHQGGGLAQSVLIFLRRANPDLAILLGVAFALRLAIYFLLPNIHYPDEIYQTLEPAHRLVFGTGILSWEWAVGIRSWLVPGLFAGLMESGRLIGDRPVSIDLPVTLFMIAASLAPVICAYFWGRRWHGGWGGIVAGGIAAIWIDLLYMAGHTLTEILAADGLTVALYLGLPGTMPIARRRLFAAGALLGLTFVLRFHLAPALLVAAFGICGIRQGFARWRILIGGASLPLLLSGILDWATLGAPFQSVWLNIWINLGAGVSAEAGTSPWTTLLLLPAGIWGLGGFAVVAAMAAVGARRVPLLLWVALAIFLTHSLVPHKEYRFIYPAIPLLVILAGIGTADLVEQARHILLKPVPPAWFAAFALALWAALSAEIGNAAVFSVPWTRERAQIEAFAEMARRPDLCGVGLYRLSWTLTPGQSALPARILLHETDTAHLGQDRAGFNYILAREQTPVPDPGFSRLACFMGDRIDAERWHMRACLWRRDGGCDPGAAPPPPVNWPRALAGTAPGADAAEGGDDSDDR
jgi:GPI mannosyltransferase 3